MIINQQLDRAVTKLTAENPKHTRYNDVSSVLKDFIESRYCVHGSGIFYCIPTATTYAERVSKNQFRRLKKHGVVPVAFLDFLNDLGIQIDRSRYTRSEMSEGQLAWMLMTERYVYKGNKAKLTAELLGKSILQSKHPELRSSFPKSVDTSQNVYVARKK